MMTSAESLADDVAKGIADWLRGACVPHARLRIDARLIKPGDVFFAVPGRRHDGRDHMGEARVRGAAAIVWEAAAGEVSNPRWLEALGNTPHRSIQDLTGRLGAIASHYYRHPSRRMDLVAVTGTNGKTSVSHWIASASRVLGCESGLIGTLGSGLPGALDAAIGLTTPDALELQSILASFEQRGVRRVAMEASSIGIDQGRLAGAEIAVAVFTNLTRDHLDYHGSMRAYGEAKAALFRLPSLRAAVLNEDDPFIETLEGTLVGSDALRPHPCRRIRYATRRPVRWTAGAEYLLAERVVETGDGLEMVLAGDFGDARVDLKVVGRFNASNALAVAATLLALGHPFHEVVEVLARLEPVAGRMQRVSGARAPLVIVDYAHTPDALAHVLATLAETAHSRHGRLWCVFGAGGDRDPGKRPEMGRVASRLADCVILTSDNPRGEPPEEILAQVAAGLERPATDIVVERAQAIRRAVVGADLTDVVLIAGKGHERWQELGGHRVPFSDAEEAVAALDARRPGGVHV